ncbi:MAG: polysaccharide deacetylase family protein, partial [Chitinophagaceae bacterium]
MSFIAPHYHKAKQHSIIRFLKRDRYWIKTPGWLKKLYPGCIWDMPKEEKILYLSFDDGPHPTITPFVLNELSKYQASASFFCIGDNVLKHPATFELLKQSGHTIGNHTQQHINGWKSSDKYYIENIIKANESIQSTLFRPPYGRIKKSQIKLLKQEMPDMKIIMWNILAGDWDAEIAPEICFERMKNKIKSGDIIVFHDSEKAAPRMQVALPQLLAHFSTMG